MIVLPFDIRRVYKGLILVNIFSFRKAEKVIGVEYGDSSSRRLRLDGYFPNDANGLGILEVPLETNQTGNNPYEFEIKAYEADGTQIDTSGAQWSLGFIF